MSDNTQPPPPAFAGIDVSKAFLDVHILPSGERRRVPNNPAGHAGLAAEFSTIGCKLVILEATGGYEYAPAAALQAAGVPVRVVNACQARRFAQGIDPKNAKTDALDAAFLAKMASLAEAIGLHARPVRPESRANFHALVERRRQLVAIAAQEKTRLHQAPTKRVETDIEQTISMIESRVKTIDSDIRKAVRQDEDLKRSQDLATSVPGIGKITANIVLAEMPELGSITNREAASLAGLAPVNRDSGTKTGARQIAGGRAKVRKALFMAAVTAMRTPFWAPFYNRLLAAGKPAKVCLTALMRKLLVVMNSILRDGKPWNPELLENTTAA